MFPAPDTATGEDLVELHLHGGPAVVSDVLDVVTKVPGVRLALAGEFTRRAFANNRLDLAQVEGLADLVAAETSSQRQQALALAGGALSQLAEGWRNRVIMVLAEAEVASAEEFFPAAGAAAEPGTVLAAESGPDTGRIVVACGAGTALAVTRLVPEGKRAMTAGEFLRGSPLRPGARLG